MRLLFDSSFFFFNDTATTEIYTLSLHDALPIYRRLPAARERHRPFRRGQRARRRLLRQGRSRRARVGREDRKSTRLNSSHVRISYAVFFLKKKKKNVTTMKRYAYKCVERGRVRA